MKNSQKGFVAPIIIIITVITVLAIGGGIVLLVKDKPENTVVNLPQVPAKNQLKETKDVSAKQLTLASMTKATNAQKSVGSTFYFDAIILNDKKFINTKIQTKLSSFIKTASPKVDQSEVLVFMNGIPIVTKTNINQLLSTIDEDNKNSLYYESNMGEYLERSKNAFYADIRLRAVSGGGKYYYITTFTDQAGTLLVRQYIEKNAASVKEGIGDFLSSAGTEQVKKELAGGVKTEFFKITEDENFFVVELTTDFSSLDVLYELAN